MISGLLMGSITVTAKGTAYPTTPYLNPIAPVSRMINRPMQNSNKDVLEYNSAKKMMNENYLNEQDFHKNNWGIKALSDRVMISRYLEIYG